MSSPLEVLVFYEKIFKFFGFFRIESRSKKLQQWMKIYTLGYQVIFTNLGFVLFSLAILRSESAKELLQILFVVFAYANAVVKSFIVYRKRRQLESLWSQLKDPEFSAKDQTENQFAEYSKRQINRIINIYSIFGVVNLMVPYLTPLVEWNKRLPFIMLVPLGFYKSTVGFCLLYIYQLGPIIYAGGLNLAVNMFLFSSLVCVDFFLMLLSSRLRRLGYPSGENEEFTVVPNTRRSFYREMCGCIQFHLKIDKLVRRVNELFNDLIFVQVVQSTFVLANSVILLVAYDLTFAEFLMPLFWMSAFCAEMYLYCYFGNNITHTFDSIQYSIYSSNFISFDRETSQAMLKMMCVTGGRQMIISAVGLVRFELSLETMLKILKTTYSIVTLLRSM